MTTEICSIFLKVEWNVKLAPRITSIITRLAFWNKVWSMSNFTYMPDWLLIAHKVPGTLRKLHPSKIINLWFWCDQTFGETFGLKDLLENRHLNYVMQKDLSEDKQKTGAWKDWDMSLSIKKLQKHRVRNPKKVSFYISCSWL